MFVIIVAAIIIAFIVAVGATVTFTLRRTSVAAWSGGNWNRLRHLDNLVEFAPVEPDTPARRAIVYLDFLAV